MTAADTPPDPKPSLLERMLDPAALHSMMACGAGVLTMGVIVWLWTVGLFDNPLVAAVALGAGNLALIGVGIGLILRTRFRLAGQGLTILGCLLLPLNLWFYDAQSLITISNGGHLWVPAVVLCGLYAGVLAILKDARYVYPLVGGITLTGLLLLADHRVGRFFEIIAPATWLVIWGAVCIHARMIFQGGQAKTDGPDSDDQGAETVPYGQAFFRAGHFVLLAGLGLLLSGRVIGHFYDDFFSGWVSFERPEVVTRQTVQLMALLLTTISAWTYGFSAQGSRFRQAFVLAAGLCVVWSGVIVFDLCNIPLTFTLAGFVAASLAAAVNLVRVWWLPSVSLSAADRDAQEWPPALLTMAAGLIVVCPWLGEVWSWTSAYDSNALRLTSMVLAVVACVAGAWRNTAAVSSLSLSQLYVRGGSLLASAAVYEAIHLAGWSLTSGLLVAALAFAAVQVAARLLPGLRAWISFTDSQVLPALLLLMSTLAADVASYSPLANRVIELDTRLAITLMSVLLWWKRPGWTGLAVGSLAGWSSLAKLFVLLGGPLPVAIAGASAWGLVLIVAHRMVNGLATTLPENARRSLSEAGSGMVLFAGLAGMFAAGQCAIDGAVTWSNVILMAVQTVVAVAAGLMQTDSRLRRGLLLQGVAHLLLGLLFVNLLSTLLLVQRVELMVTVLGALLLTSAHFAWRREEHGHDPGVSMALGLGSLMSVLPMLLSLVAIRGWGTSQGPLWIAVHEAGVLLIALTLLGSGLLCRIRSTVLAGGGALMVYVCSLALLIDVPDQLQTVSVYLMLIGGAFFVVSVLLSAYRDALMQLPKKVRNGEGVFQVLKWR